VLGYIQYPQWLKPQIIPGLPLHWYGLMYIIAFGITYILFNYQVKQERLSISKDETVNYFFWVILSLLVGARLFATTIYDPSLEYLRKPWLIFWPFDSDFRLVGLAGMSYHGGVVGAVAGALVYCKVKKVSFLKYADLTIAGIPLGYTFGRLGNFINGELWGRVTGKPWGMIFTRATTFSLKEEWVAKMAERLDLFPSNGINRVNFPRHPSQLYEAFFEGIFLWAVIWFLFRKKKKYDGFLLGIYLIGYGIIRFIIEYFREPDAELGFLLSFGPGADQPYLFTSLMNISTGQILCLLMILFGIITLSLSKTLYRKEQARLLEIQNKTKASRKFRKKIK